MSIFSKIKFIDVIFISAIGYLVLKSGILKAQAEDIEIPDNEATLANVQSILGSSNYNMLITYFKSIWNHSVFYGIDPAIVSAIIMRESSGNASAKTWEPNANQYSYGLMQILESTARGLGFNASMDVFLTDPDFDIYYGTMLLNQLKKRFPNDLIRIIAYYNAGNPEIYGKNTYINAEYINDVLQRQRLFRKAFKLMVFDYQTRFPDSIWLRN